MKIKEHLDPASDQFKYQLFLLIEKVKEELDGTENLVDVTIETHRKTRSNLQNRYYWFIIQMIADELGYHRDTVHNYMKTMFLGFEEYDMPDGKKFVETRSTRDETTVSFEEYLIRIRRWASDFLSMYIPLPNETPYNYLEVK